MSYEAAGVDYDVLDAAKRRALDAAVLTSAFPLPRGAEVVEASRGEPAVLVSARGVTIGAVLECLGTKSRLAAEYEAATGTDRFDAIGYDTVAAAVNDLVCVGALPVLVNAYFATGAASWYEGRRHASLVAGWQRACRDAGAAWGGGESPTLAGVVVPDQIDLAASAIGIVAGPGGASWLGSELAPGDDIVLVASTGLHTNGASLARRLAGELSLGYRQPLPDGREFGDALLDESAIYVRLVEELVAVAAPVTYVSHITGHGLRKLMRADRELTYRVSRLPEVPAVLRFLAEGSGLHAHEAYGTLNMGTGLAIFCRPGAGEQVVAAAGALGYAALIGGRVEAGPRQVLLEPVGVRFAADELRLR